MICTRFYFLSIAEANRYSLPGNGWYLFLLNREFPLIKIIPKIVRVHSCVVPRVLLLNKPKTY